MASFTVRILLKGNPPPSEYGRLYNEMDKKHFTRTIESNDGIIYDLPDAEYNIIGNYDRGTVLNLAKEAVRSVGKGDAEILVTESAGRTWSNLKKHSTE